MTKSIALFSLIFLIFLITRLSQITKVPNSFYWDEVSIGYNALSIAQYGMDEWGDQWPAHFRAFGEFKLPVYVYSVAILDKLLGVADFNVRLPAVIFSLVTLVLVYLITYKITKQAIISLFSAWFLSTTPWLFIFSRTGFEATAGLMFYLTGIYFYLSSHRFKWALIGISFLFSLYSYNSFRILVPLTVGAFFLLTLFAGQKRKSRLMGWFIIIGILLIGSIPIIRLTLLDSGANRLQTVGIFTQASSSIELVRLFFSNYLSHFSPQFLILSGDSNPRLNLPGSGELYLMSLPLILLGLWKVFQEKGSKLWLVFLLLIAPLPAAITTESPHALRAITLAPVLAILMALGIMAIAQRIPKLSSGVYLSAVILSGLFFANYLNQYFSSYNQKSSSSWQYAYKEVFTKYSPSFRDYDWVVLTDSLAQPYIFALYYQRYDVKNYLASVQYNSIDQFGFSKVKSFDKFVFQPIKEETLPSGKLLVIRGAEENFNKGELVGQISELDGTPSLFFYQYQKD